MLPSVFCFITHEQLSLLKNQWLKFESAADLADEFLENKKVHRKPVKQVRLSDSEFASALKPVYEAMEEHMKAMVSWEYYLEQAKQNREKIEPQLQKPVSSGQPLAKISDYEKVCLLRLFPTLEHIAIWQQQGQGSEQGHAGIALELDADHDFFKATQFKGKPQLMSAISYDDARPPLPNKAQPFPALLRRPEHLAYQQEQRLIRPISSVEKDTDGQHLFRLPKGLLKGIYVGLECPASISQDLLKLKQTDLMFKRLPLWHMVVSETHLRLLPMALTE